MNIIGKIALGTAAALCLGLSAGCSSETPFMGNTREAVLEEGDVFAVISIMDYGDITIKLFPDAAPMAVTRFIQLADNGYYDGRTFHRVVKDQLIQGGSLTGSGFDGEVAAQEYFDIETSDYMRHYYGAVCMASNSSGNYCQFYIVNNNKKVNIDEVAETLKADLDDEEISAGLLETDKEYYNEYYKKLSSIPEEVKERYAEVGGIYDLDGTDTVFGQVVDGWEVLKKLNEVETVAGNITDDRSDIASKPLDEIVIEKVEVIHITPAETTTEEKTRPSRTTPTEASDAGSGDDNIIINDGDEGEIEDGEDDEAVTADGSEASEPEETTTFGYEEGFEPVEGTSEDEAEDGTEADGETEDTAEDDAQSDDDTAEDDAQSNEDTAEENDSGGESEQE